MRIVLGILVAVSVAVGSPASTLAQVSSAPISGVGLYAQDTWRMSERVTLNYGVRWEPFVPMVWRENEYGGIRVYNFDVEGFQAGRKSVVFPTAPAGFTYPRAPTARDPRTSMARPAYSAA